MTTLKELEELEAKATYAPWTVEVIWAQECGCGHAVNECKGAEYSKEFKANNKLIETTRNALPDLIRVIELAEEALINAQATLRYYRLYDLEKVEKALSEIRKLKGE